VSKTKQRRDGVGFKIAVIHRKQKRAYDFSVESIPAGFKVVRLEYGDTLYCEACNRLADTKMPELSLK
jgi:hypothetical protein